MDTEVLDHFRLDDDPFISLPGGPLLETRDVKQGRKIMDRLIHKGGLGAFIAASGGGKSTIWWSMAQKYTRPQTAFVVPQMSDFPKRTAREIAVEIVREIGDERATLPKSTTAVNRILRESMGRWVDDRKRIILVLEEAHHLRYWPLLALKTFIEMTWHVHGPLLGILLVGQERLRTNLQQYAEVGDRTRIYSLKGFSRQELRAYIRLRIESVGGDPAIFEPAAIDALAKKTGMPRIANRLCGEALERAYYAGRKAVTLGDIEGVNGEADLKNLQAKAAEAKDKGIDQKQVADRLGKSKTTVNQIIHGRYPSPDLLALRKAVSSAYDELLREKAAA